VSRALVICCDGTSNQFGTHNTNVVRLVQALAEHPTREHLVFYDPGVGTLPEPSLATRCARWVHKWVDRGFAVTLDDKVQRAYTFLMDVWHPGDDVYLFGFSRGAYTVRVLAGMLHSLGLLPPLNQNLVPYAWRLFSTGRDGDEGGGERSYWRLSNEFRSTFARPVPHSGDRRFPVRFAGLWDTVSSVGWIWDPETYPYTARNPGIRTVRQAIALDERRAFYRQNRMYAQDDQDLKEVWFAGVHSDVGGGYAVDEGGLWRAPLEWILLEAAAAGLEVDPTRLSSILKEGPNTPVWSDRIHVSLKGAWWLAEIFPKMRTRPGGRWSLPRANLARPRRIPVGAMLHRSLLERIHRGDARPRNLSPEFLASIAAALPDGDAPYRPHPHTQQQQPGRTAGAAEGGTH
jgi:uncharacterized protein (DUF2235 family)